MAHITEWITTWKCFFFYILCTVYTYSSVVISKCISHHIVTQFASPSAIVNPQGGAWPSCPRVVRTIILRNEYLHQLLINDMHGLPKIIFKQIFFPWFITFLCLCKELLLGTSLTVSWQALLGAHTVTAQVKRRRKNDHWIRKTSIIAILYDHNWISRMITFCWSSFFSDHQLIYFLLLTGRKNTVTVQVKSNPPNPDKNIADKILALLYLTPSHSSPVKWSSCYSCLNSLSPFSGFEQNCVPGRFVTIWLLIPVYQNCF